MFWEGLTEMFRSFSFDQPFLLLISPLHLPSGQQVRMLLKVILEETNLFPKKSWYQKVGFSVCFLVGFQRSKACSPWCSSYAPAFFKDLTGPLSIPSSWKTVVRLSFTRMTWRKDKTSNQAKYWQKQKGRKKMEMEKQKGGGKEENQEKAVYWLKVLVFSNTTMASSAFRIIHCLFGYGMQWIVMHLFVLRCDLLYVLYLVKTLRTCGLSIPTPTFTVRLGKAANLQSPHPLQINSAIENNVLLVLFVNALKLKNM